MVEAHNPQNGGYPVIKSEKREHRDPYAGWWDEQERRDYNETVHEDNDILGRFATEDYTWTTAGWGWVLMGSFVATFLGVLGVVYVTYPDKPAVPRTFPDGLEQELGGKGTMRVSSAYFSTVRRMLKSVRPSNPVKKLSGQRRG